TSGIGSNVLRSKAQSDSLITLFGAGVISSARDNGQTDSIKTNILDIAATIVRNKDQSDSLIALFNAPADNLGNHTATQKLDLGTQTLVGNGGTTGIEISNSGNVGIKTSATTSSGLTINENTAANGMLVTQQSNASTKAAVKGQVSGTTGTNSYALDGEATSTSTNNYGLHALSTGTGTGTNYGVFGKALGATTNWAGYFEDGNVYVQNNLGLGTLTPGFQLEVSGESFFDGNVGIGVNAGLARLAVEVITKGNTIGQTINADSENIGVASGLEITVENGAPTSRGILVNATGGTSNIAADFAAGDVIIRDSLQIIRNAADGKVFTSDASGYGSWKDGAFNTDNQYLSIVGDSIKIDRGRGAYIGNIQDSLTAHTGRINLNALNVKANQTSIGIIASELITLGDDFEADSTLLQSHIDLDNDTSSSNETNTIFQVNGANLEITDASGTLQVPLNTINTGGVFETIGDTLVRDTGGYDVHDFVIGSPQLDDSGNALHDSRMFFDKSKGAFRAGRVTFSEWDNVNIGVNSVAFGNTNTASGIESTVGGGSNNTADNIAATIGGGRFNTASGIESTVGGGLSNTAIGLLSTVGGGQRDTASGDFSTIGGGFTNIASGNYSAILGGIENTAQSYGEMVFGTYSAPLISGFDALNYTSTDRLFVVGNGVGSFAKSNALVMLKNGTTFLNGQLNLSDGTDTLTYPNTDGAANEILKTDGLGNLTFVPVSSLISVDTFSVIQSTDRSRFVRADTVGEIGFGINGSKRFSVLENRLEFTEKTVFIGTNAGENQSFAGVILDGEANVAIGYDALKTNGTSTAEVAIGPEALMNSGSSAGGNTAIGAQALKLNDNGGGGTAVGRFSLSNVSSGSNNTALGSSSLLNLTSGAANTAFGAGAGQGLAIGQENIFVGNNAGVPGSYSSRLYLDNTSGGSTPIIYGDLAEDSLVINGVLTIDSLKNGSGYTFPGKDGTADQVMVTDGLGNVNWSAVPIDACPIGMVAAGTSMCIETAERGAATWFNAAITCASLGYKLPSWAEWFSGASIGGVSLTDTTNDWEWVDGGTANTARKVGNGGLTNTANDTPTNAVDVTYRCVTYKY
ncbi:MAG: hypothetical protein ACI9DK_000217, partial [Vicingaceae bacterium]